MKFLYFQEFDVSNKGFISFHDFHRELFDVMLQGTHEEHIRMVFSLMDNDGDGLITSLELIRLFAKVGEELSEKEALKYCDDLTEGSAYGLMEYDKFRDYAIGIDKFWNPDPIVATPSEMGSEEEEEGGSYYGGGDEMKWGSRAASTISGGDEMKWGSRAASVVSNIFAKKISFDEPSNLSVSDSIVPPV